ncbi:MAG: hypothetical protein JW779_07320 [Candidatus Thorarchaeota archaeon]|nr:hypothetical protein [Candidatus Thorarchaeota archaeon]
MPKRARCPHCDKLFNRDELDRHIVKCRSRARGEQSSVSKRKKRTIVVDGNNIAYHLSPENKPLVNNLLLAHNSLTNGGYRPIFVISTALFHKIDKPDILNSVLGSLEMVQAPRGMNDDLKIIQTAQDRNADILSNDRFLDWLDRYPWISERLRKYRMTPTGLIML